MKLSFAYLQTVLPAALPLVEPEAPKRELSQEEVRKRLVRSLRGEYNEIHNDLDDMHNFYRSDNCYRGLMRHHSCNGDSFHFHDSSVTGRLEFAQQSGLFCNLDDSCR